MKERLIEFLAYLEIGQDRFEKKVGLSKGFVNKVGDSIRENNLNKISAIYPVLNINWLKTGEGDMLKPVNVQKLSVKGNNNSIMGGNVSGDNNTFNKHDYHQGLTHDDFVKMIEERFHHMQQKEKQILKKDDLIEDIFVENRKFIESILDEYKKMSSEIAKCSEDNRKLIDRIHFLTDKLLEK